MMTFHGRANTTGFAAHVVIRFTPTMHAVGDPPPLPPKGCFIPIRTPVASVTVKVVLSHPDRMLIEVAGRRWGLTPIRPAEIDLVSVDTVSVGATDWVIRAEG